MLTSHKYRPLYCVSSSSAFTDGCITYHFENDANVQGTKDTIHKDISTSKHILQETSKLFVQQLVNGMNDAALLWRPTPTFIT